MEARATESQKLLNWGYTAWDAVRLFDPEKPVATPALWKGEAKTARQGNFQDSNSNSYIHGNYKYVS